MIIEFLIFRLLYSRCGIDNIAVSERFRSLFSDKINATELVTFVPPSSGPFRFFWICRTLCAVRCRKSVSNPRGGGRIAYRRCCPFGCEEKTLPGCRLRNSPIHSTSHRMACDWGRFGGNSKRWIRSRFFIISAVWNSELFGSNSWREQKSIRLA